MGHENGFDSCNQNHYGTTLEEKRKLLYPSFHSVILSHKSQKEQDWYSATALRMHQGAYFPLGVKLAETYIILRHYRITTSSPSTSRKSGNEQPMHLLQDPL